MGRVVAPWAGILDPLRRFRVFWPEDECMGVNGSGMLLFGGVHGVEDLAANVEVDA